MRIGIDLGGTKIEAAVLADDADVVWRRRLATPQGDYAATLEAVAELVAAAKLRGGTTVGVGTPGSLSPRTGLIRNANSVVLNGKPLEADLWRRRARSGPGGTITVCAPRKAQSPWQRPRYRRE